jgi:predicted ArsR family transcriptional regulator
MRKGPFPPLVEKVKMIVKKSDNLSLVLRKISQGRRELTLRNCPFDCHTSAMRYICTATQQILVDKINALSAIRLN